MALPTKMGRINWKEHVSTRGPGRKAKKQGNPELPLELQKQDKDIKKTKSGHIGGRIQQRARRRVLRAALKQEVKKQEVKKTKIKKKSIPIKSPPPTHTSSDASESELESTNYEKKELFSGGSDGKD